MNRITSFELEEEDEFSDLRQFRCRSTSFVHSLTSISCSTPVLLSPADEDDDEEEEEEEEEEEVMGEGGLEEEAVHCKPRKTGMLLLLDSSSTDFPSCSSKSNLDSWRSSRFSKTWIAAAWSEVAALVVCDIIIIEWSESSVCPSSRPWCADKEGEQPSSSSSSCSFPLVNMGK
jgi:hypothetical protein